MPRQPNLVVWTSLWGNTLPAMLGEQEQRDRFSYALREAMDARQRSARWLAQQLGVDARLVGKWLRSEDLPNLYQSQVIAAVLEIDEELFRNPPEAPQKPYYPIERYLLESAGEEGRRRAAKRLDEQARGAPSPKPAQPPRDSATEPG